MKLTTHYYRLIVPAVMVLFVAVIGSAYFLIRHALQRELDLGLLRSKSRIEAYVKANGRLPQVSGFDDEHVVFAAVPAGSVDSFSNTMLYIPEQKKMHISRKLNFSLVANGRAAE